MRVVLYGVTDFTGDETRLRLQPMACAIDGALVVGVRCGEAMPPEIEAHIVGGATIRAVRTATDFHDTAGDQIYKAPRGPECCSYNGCRGDTVPYLAAPKSARPEPPPDGPFNLVDHGGHHVIAVWPPDADVGLVAHARDAGSGGEGPAKFAVEQLVRVGDSAVLAGRPASERRCASCAALFSRRGDAPWTPVDVGGPGADGFIVMVTTDLDGDGRPEAVVRERDRNGYGAMFLGADWSKPQHTFGCGGI